MDTNIEKLREKLNEVIERGVNPDEILKISIELDRLIEEYVEKNGKKVHK